MKPFPSARAAYTMTELLVTGVVIVVLGLLIFDDKRREMAASDSMACAAHLRLIGVALLSYTNDHDDQLPGPLDQAQYPTFKDADTGSLPKLLAPYIPSIKTINDPRGSGSTNVMEPFVCPAYQRRFPKLDEADYALNMRKIPKYDQPAWGDATKNQPPLKMSNLQDWTKTDAQGVESPVGLEDVVAMRDADQADRQFGSAAAANGAPMVDRPVHHTYRNALFFDLHTGRTNLGD